MTADLVAYFESIGPDLLSYLDEDRGLALGTVEDLYSCGVALLQGQILPEHLAKDWEDFFPLAEAFVLAYGSERLVHQNRRAALLAVGRGEAPFPLTGTDRSLLVDLVRELGEFVSAHKSYEPDEGPTGLA